MPPRGKAIDWSHALTTTVPQEGPRAPKDFAVQVRVRNGRLLAAIRAQGHASIKAFCRAYNFHYTMVSRLVLMHAAPFKLNGQPTIPATQVAEALNVPFEELFPARLMAAALSRSPRSVALDLTDEQIEGFLGSPPATPEDYLRLADAEAAINRGLLMQDARHERVLRLHYGLNGFRDETLETVAQQMDLTRERVRQIEGRAVTRFKSPSRRRAMRDAVEGLGGVFEYTIPALSPSLRERQEMAGLIHRPPASKPQPKVDEAAKKLRRKRRFPARDAQAQRERAEIEQARAYWATIDRGFASEVYRLGRVIQAGTLRGARLQVGASYWLPASLLDARGNIRLDPEPDFIRLLRIPAEARSDEVKRALAYHLEREFVRRGAGAVTVKPDSSGYIAQLDPAQVALAKYQWFMDNWVTLWKAFPPEPN